MTIAPRLSPDLPTSTAQVAAFGFLSLLGSPRHCRYFNSRVRQESQEYFAICAKEADTSVWRLTCLAALVDLWLGNGKSAAFAESVRTCDRNGVRKAEWQPQSLAATGAPLDGGKLRH